MVDTSDLESIVTNPIVLQSSDDKNLHIYSHNETSRVDILFKLHKKQLWVIVRTILLLLPPADLYRVAQVSKKWRMICTGDRSISIRRKKYYNQIQKLRLGKDKENVSIIIPRTHTVLRSISLPQTNSSTCNVSPNKIIHFPNGILYKHRDCPFCSSAATNISGKKFRCKSGTCNSEFCSACLQHWQPSHEVMCKSISCSPESSPSKLLVKLSPSVQKIIGNTLSRKRLKRLLK